MKSNLVKRIVTGVIMAIILIAAIESPWRVRCAIVITFTATIIGTAELFAMTKLRPRVSRKLTLLIGMVACIPMMLLGMTEVTERSHTLVLAYTLVSLFFSVIVAFTLNKHWKETHIGWYVVTPLFWIVPGMLGATYLASLPFGHHWVYFAVVPAALGDIGGMLAGKTLGGKILRVKPLPVVSPNKSCEGYIGGLILAMIGLIVLRQIRPIPIDFPGWVYYAYGTAVAVAGMMFDAFESLIKRTVDAKDSGTIIPGHGGILDRIDSHIGSILLVVLLATTFYAGTPA